MNFTNFRKKLKTNFGFRKKFLLIGGIAIVGTLALVFLVKDTSMSAAVLNLSKQNITKQQPKQVGTCTDTDGGTDHAVKGVITVTTPTYTRVEEDTCNANGSLKEWFCGNPGEAAGLLRSENYVDCEYGCNNGACSPAPTTGNIIKDLSIENGSFVAANNHEATFSITVKNIGNIALPIDGLGHTLYLNGSSTPTVLTNNYTIEFFTTPSLSLLQPNDTYVISAKITLDDDLTFTYSDTLHVDIGSYPEVDDNMQNNAMILYMTGQIVDCNTPENVLACSLGLASCPVACTGMGDVVIENMYITPNANPTIGTNNNTNKINLVIKNIGNRPINIPYTNGGNRFDFICYYPQGNGGFSSTDIQQNTLSAGESYSTQLLQQGNDDFNRFTTLGSTFIKCIIVSQQQQGRTPTDPNSTQVVYEADGTNNSFTLNYDVTSNKSVKSVKSTR